MRIMKIFLDYGSKYKMILLNVHLNNENKDGGIVSPPEEGEGSYLLTVRKEEVAKG